VDLPTFGRPTRAITGTIRLSTLEFLKMQRPLQGSGRSSGGVSYAAA